MSICIKNLFSSIHNLKVDLWQILKGEKSLVWNTASHMYICLFTKGRRNSKLLTGLQSDMK